MPDTVATKVWPVAPVMIVPSDFHWFPLGELLVSVTLPPAQKVVGPPAEIVGVAGGGLTVTVVAAEVAAQPAASVTVTVTTWLVLTVIDCVVAPVDQSHDAPLFAVSVTLLPAQNVVGPDGVMVAVGVDTETVALLVAVGQLVTKTETVRVIGSVVDASNVTTLLVVEPAIDPLTIVHAYVAPGTAGVEAVCPVELAQTDAGAVMAGVPGQPTTPTLTLLELLVVLTSGVVVLTVAVFVIVVPVAGAVTPMVMAGAVPTASVPALNEQVMTGFPLQLQFVSVPLLTSVTPEGRVSVTITFAAPPAPALVTVIV